VGELSTSPFIRASDHNKQTNQTTTVGAHAPTSNTPAGPALKGTTSNYISLKGSFKVSLVIMPGDRQQKNPPPCRPLLDCSGKYLGDGENVTWSQKDRSSPINAAVARSRSIRSLLFSATTRSFSPGMILHSICQASSMPASSLRSLLKARCRRYSTAGEDLGGSLQELRFALAECSELAG
jgi:hypothetical protein